jgi:hypothetical protein
MWYLQAEMFLNLLFKALKEDIDLRRMAAFAKRLTQVIALYLMKYSTFSCIITIDLFDCICLAIVW